MYIRRLFPLCFLLSFVLCPVLGTLAPPAFGADPARCSYEPDDDDVFPAPQVRPAAMNLSGRQVRAFHAHIADAVKEEDGGYIAGRARPFTSQIKPEHLSQLDFYGLPGSVFMNGDSDVTLAVPKGWRLVRGAIGANGSASVGFKPTSGPGYLIFHQTSACVGCAYSEAAAFFPEARRLCREFYDDEDSCARLSPSVQHVKLKPHVVGYRLEGQGGNRMDGVASFNDAVDAPKYWEAAVCLPPGQLHLGNPILNRFLGIYQGN